MSAKPWWVDLAKAHVLVEDEFTQSLLAATWSDVDVRVEHVGGDETVRGMVNDAHLRNVTTVFGVRDRDFSVSSGWAGVSPSYRFERHEAENYLLDFDALAPLAGDSPAAVDDAATTFARDCCAWMAARRVLWEINGGLVEHFPQLPGPSQQAPLALDAAVAQVKDATYWQGLNKKLKQHWTDRALEGLVHQHHETFADEVSSGKWITTFSGKEVLQHLRGKFAGLTKRGASKVDEVDLAKLVARQWHAHHRVPLELANLLAEIKRRAKLTGPTPSPSPR